jgi:hypothetical protein
MDVVRAIHGYPIGYPSTAVTGIWCMLWDHRLLEILNDNATLLTKAISTVFVLIVVGSLLLFSSLEISKAASRSIYRTKWKGSESYNPETHSKILREFSWLRYVSLEAKVSEPSLCWKLHRLDETLQ